MSRVPKQGRRARPRAYHPALDGARLEPRLVLAHTPYALTNFLLTHPQVGYAYKFNSPPFVTGSKAHHFDFGFPLHQGHIATQTARGGQSLIVAAPDGSRFRVSLTLADNQYDGGLAAQTGGTGTGVIPTAVVQPQGTIRAYPMPGGKVGLIVDGSTMTQQVTIDPLPFHQRKGYAHSFAYGEASRSHLLNIGSFQVTNGSLQAILAFHSADLSGPLSIGGTTKVDRIAFNALLPGAAIGVGGTLNTLDVANGVNLTSGPGISVGGDLNLLNVGQDMILANGASLTVGRFLGGTPQPPKGTGTGSNFLSLNQAQIGTGTAQLTPSVSAYIQGNLTVGPGSTVNIVSGVANSSATSLVGSGAAPSPLLIGGSLNLASGTYNTVTGRITSPQFLVFNNVFLNQILTGVNVVGRNGLYIAGTQILPPS